MATRKTMIEKINALLVDLDKTSLEHFLGEIERVARKQSMKDDAQLFYEAFKRLDKNRSLIYVRICNMRRELGWSEYRFNTVLCKLRVDGNIMLHACDVHSMTKEDIQLSYTDSNNFFYGTITWRRPL